MHIYKFVKWDVEPAKDLKLEDILKNYSKHCSACNDLLSTGIYKSGGWAYDIRENVKKFLINQYGRWREVYAPNKTTVRKCTYGRIEKIVEL